MDTHFGRSFERKLVEVIEGGAIPRSMGVRFSEEANQKVIKSDRLKRSLYEFNRVFMRIMCDFCRIDIMNNKSACSRAREWHSSGKPNVTKTKRWPQVLFAFHSVSAIMILINTYYSYIHHANILKLHKLEEHLKRRVGTFAMPAGSNLSELRLEFELRAESSRRQLEMLGANHLSWTFVSETIVLLFLPTTLISYLIIPLLCSLCGCLLITPGGLMNRRRECEFRAELVIAELKRFSSSSESFVLSRFSRIRRERLASSLSSRRESGCYSDWSHPGFGLQESGSHLHQLHQATLRLLKGIALEGRLNPLGRTRAARHRQTIFFAACTSFMFLFMQGSLAAGYLFLRHILNGDTDRKRNFLDHLDAFNLIFICEHCANVALPIMSIFAITIYEQFQSVTSLRSLILDLIKKNRNGLIDPRELELNLLTIIIQNRIIIRSFDLAKRPLIVIASFLIYFCVSQPLIFKLHSAYFDPRVRWVSSFWILDAVGCTFLYIYSLGLLHQAYIKTFRCLWSLVAQLSDLERQSNKTALTVERSFATLTIRRELADEEKSTDRFACRLGAIPITNTNIIRLAFYSLLILISLSSDYKVLGDKLTRVMRDPFKLYDFLRGR